MAADGKFQMKWEDFDKIWAIKSFGQTCGLLFDAKYTPEN